jgi:mono/diheme cytochrome c family protein
MRVDRVASAFRRKLVILRRKIALVVLLAGAAIVAAQEARSVWDGVYTEDQAKRGEAIYFDRCVRCHGATYMGGTDGAGPLVGPTFNGNWNSVKLDQMLDRVRLTMPMDKPASLSRQQTADALAFLLSINKIPAGKTELPRQAEMLALIQYKATK